MNLEPLQPLTLPVPPMLEDALGYPGIARYVAFYWIPTGDELVWDEGWRSADGAWQGWLMFTRHPRVAPFLARHHFGDSDIPPTHWLLLDRETRTCCAGPAAAVAQALRTGNPAPDTAAWPGRPAGEPLPAFEDAWKALVKGFREVQVTVTTEEIAQHLAEHGRILAAMSAWLDAQAG